MDPQLQQRLMMFGGFVPGGIALLVLIVVWYLHAFKLSRIDPETQDDHEESEGSKPRVSGGPRLALPILLAIGFAGADYAANESFQLWPDSNSYRFTHAVAVVMLVGLIEGLVRLPLVLAFLIRTVGYGGAFWMLAEGYVPGVFADTSVLVGSTIFAGMTSAIVATGADKQSEKTPAWIDAISWLLIAGASMPIFLKNHFSTGAMIPAGIIAVLVSAMLTGLIFREFRIARGGVSLLVGFMLIMLTGSIIQTGATNLPAVLLLGSAPLVMTVSVSTQSKWKHLAARVVMLAAVLGSASGLVFLNGDAQDDDPYGSGSYLDYLNEGDSSDTDTEDIESDEYGNFEGTP